MLIATINMEIYNEDITEIVYKRACCMTKTLGTTNGKKKINCVNRE